MENVDPTANVPGYLKCPICMDLPKKKVFQCPSGHTVCEECHSRLNRCPQCRVPLGAQPIRNLVVEQMLDELSFDCQYKGNGCNQKLDRKSLEEHLQSCSYSLTRSASASTSPPATLPASTPIPPSTILSASTSQPATLPWPAMLSASTSPPTTSASPQTVEINARDERGDTELHRAVARVDEDLVNELVMELGADVNIKNRKLQTPLHIAGTLCSRTSDKDIHLRIIKFLVDKGTDVFAKDDQNMNDLPSQSAWELYLSHPTSSIRPPLPIAIS